MKKSNPKPMTKEERNARNEFLKFVKYGKPRDPWLKKLQQRHDERHEQSMSMLPASVEEKICKAIEKELNKHA